MATAIWHQRPTLAGLQAMSQATAIEHLGIEFTEVGDVIAGLMGAYLIWEARNLGLPKWKLWRMAGNLGFDTAIGAVPLLGDAFDLFFRSNSRNLRIVKRHLDKHHPETQVIEG